MFTERSFSRIFSVFFISILMLSQVTQVYADDSWTSAGALTHARHMHTATLLANGQVLVSGGTIPSEIIATAELYNPSINTWADTGNMVEPRFNHTATLLNNGEVLVVGGWGSSGRLASVELYDPTTGTWSSTGSLAQARSSHTATLLANGQVLVVGGGGSGGYLSTAELYDPTSGTWSNTGSLAQNRFDHTATLLTNGQVLVVGGYGSGGGYRATAELYDPASGNWTSAGALSQARYAHTATLLANGQVLVVAGYNSSGYISTSELYDPISGIWTSTGTLSQSRYYQTATRLPNDQVLVVGGYGSAGFLSSAELYDPVSGVWTSVSLLGEGRYYHTATLLANGEVLAVGGFGNSGDLASAELYSTATPTATPTSTLIPPSPSNTPTFTPTPTYIPTNTSTSPVITTLDTTGNVGQYTSLALNNNGFPVISYYDSTNGDLKVAVCGDETCTSGNAVATVDSSGNVGIWTSLTLNDNGFPVISYNDQTNGDLKVAVCGNTTCTSGNTITTVDNTGNVGSWSSLALNSNDFPVISYIDETNSDLKVAVCGTETCSSGNTTTTVDSAGYVGFFTSLVLNSNGFPIISYWDQGNQDLKVAVCGNINCTSGNTLSIVDSTGDVGRYSSLALTTNDHPVVSYWDVTNYDLKVAICGDATCTSGNTLATVDNSSGDIGHYTSLKLNENDSPVISYYDYNNGDLKVTVCGNTTCTSGNTLTTVDSTGYVGTYTSLELNNNGYPVISYYDNTNLDLKVVICGNATCTLSVNPTSIPTYVPTATNTPTDTPTSTQTSTPTFTSTPTDTPTFTPTATITPTPLPTLVPASWTLTGPMSLARWGHTATLLPDGRVLVAGGRNGSTTYADAEIFNPVTGQWSSTGSMNQARNSHTATLLPNGKVLVAGGGSNSSELYDPLTGLWTLSGTMNAAHSSHTATLLANGKVLVTGGAFSLAIAELYDPNTGLWTPTGSLNTGRYNHTATLLTNGKVIITGGVDANSPTANKLATSELYDPNLGTWIFTGALNEPRTQHSSILLSDGMVLVAGGSFSNSLSSAELYNPITGTWTSTGSMASARLAGPNMLLLADGKALIVGGGSSGSEIYNPNTGIWSDMTFMSIGRQFHATTLLLDGRVLTTGGNTSAPLSSAELYGPISAPTATPTDIPTSTFTFTPAPTYTSTDTPSPTPTDTPTSTPTETYTPTPTATDTATSTPTNTYTPTLTETPTFTPTPDFSLSLLAPANGEQLLYNRPTFDWTDVPDALSYTIQISNNIGFTSPTSIAATSSTYTQPTNLTANVTRYWRVQANTVSGSGPWSEIRNFKTANPPSAPGLVAPANNGLVTDYTPVLDWNNSTVPVVTTFLKYELQIATDNTFASPTIIDISGDVTASSYAPTAELDPNTTYYWRVRAYNTLGHYSAWSTRSFRTALLPPSLNTPNDADQLLDNRPVFDWDDVPGVTGYRIQISDVNDFTTTLVNVVVTPSTYIRTTDLPANTTLYWRVHSRGTNGPSAWSDVRILTTANPPSVPTLVSPANNAEVSGSSLFLNWDDALLPVGIMFDHYQIQVAADNTFTMIVHDQTISGVTNSQDNSALLAPGATYWWRVRSFNVDGHSSAWSTVRSVRIKFAGPALNLPTNGSAASGLTPTFTWDAVSGATGYTIQVSKNNSFSPLVINTITSTNSYTHGTNLQAGTIYYWRVRVNTPAAYGPGDWSEVFTFTTP